MNPPDVYELREAVRQVLEKHNLLANVQLEFDLMQAIRKAVQPDIQANVPADVRQQTTFDALVRGMNKNAQMEADWTRLFHTTPNWNTKTNKELMVWMKERADHGETLDRFAEWWFANDWRGKSGSPPATSIVREQWGLAFAENSKQGDSRPYTMPEGL